MLLLLFCEPLNKFFNKLEKIMSNMQVTNYTIFLVWSNIVKSFLYSIFVIWVSICMIGNALC